jgi:hypothetical protein
MAETCTVLPLAADEKGLMISAIRIPESCLESLNTPGVSVFLDWGTNEHVCYHAQQPRTTSNNQSTRQRHQHTMCCNPTHTSFDATLIRVYCCVLQTLTIDDTPYTFTATPVTSKEESKPIECFVQRGKELEELGSISYNLKLRLSLSASYKDKIKEKTKVDQQKTAYVC